MSRDSCHFQESVFFIFQRFQELPTLLWFLNDYGLSASEGMEVICIVGMLASLICLFSQRMRDSMMFAVLWLLYLSVYLVSEAYYTCSTMVAVFVCVQKFFERSK